jgi:signal transduction histidine kinase
MYDKEIVNAICKNHLYEYFIVNHHFEVLKYSESIVKYCKDVNLKKKKLSLFDIAPELVGMEESLNAMLAGGSEALLIPLIFKAPEYYVNLRVHHDSGLNTLIILFENITEMTKTQHNLRQVHNENLLLLDEIADKNRQLETFNQEMQRLVDEEVAKNLEKKHMMELQTRHAQMGEMIAMITHQWKQPLSVIQTVGTLLKMEYALGKLDKKRFSEKIDNLLKQATHLNQTVNDFQKFFTPSKEKVLFDVKETIVSVLSLVEMEYGLQNIKIVLKEETPVSIFGYANEYKQVLLAILQNAKDALLQNKQHNRQITICIQKQDKCSLVTIEDNAGGIPKGMIEIIFNQYITTKEKGSGLGLYIAKSVIEDNMQGKLWVENIRDGALFSLSL